MKKNETNNVDAKKNVQSDSKITKNGKESVSSVHEKEKNTNIKSNDRKNKNEASPNSRITNSKRKKKFFNPKLWKEKYLMNPRVVFNIYKNDLREISRNFAVLVVILGLTIVPSLYAWFNIKAFWDPYGSTKYLKVAVVNQDRGDKFRDQELNMGEKVVENLKANPSLDWQFVSKSRAEVGLKTGEYYAIILIPPEFSSDLTSVTKKDVKKATIDYTVNEKINAVAPKITDSGANAITQQINKTLVETVSKVSLGALGGVSNAMGDMDPRLDKMKDTLKRLDRQLDNLNKLSSTGDKTLNDLERSLNTTKNGMPNIQTTINDSKKLNSSIQNSLKDANTSFNDISPEIKSDLELTSDLIGQLSDLATGISDKGAIVNEDAVALLLRMKSKTNSSINMIEGLIDVLERINRRDSPLLNSAISDLNDILKILEDLNNTISDSIRLAESGHDLSSDAVSKMVTLSDSLNRRVDDLLSHFDTKIANPINKIHKSTMTVTNDLSKVMDDANKIYPGINTLLSDATSITSTLKGTTSVTQDSIKILKDQVSDSIKNIEEIQNNEDFKDFNNIIKSNILDRVDFLKNPINLKENKIYKMENYGSAMTPFYSVLAAWVGGLVLVAVLSTKVPGKNRSVDEYFGRMMLYITLAVGQSLIIALGDFFILGVTAKHPVLFTLILIFCSIVFTVIIYSTVSLFGTVGKGICVFLLVIQIGGSGGTFPIQMTPDFFKAINSVIPFTYGINACREAVGGIYLPNLYHDLTALLIFMIIPLVFAILFKGPINRLGHPLNKMFNNSFLIGH
ncbi:MAG: YhgE/Pip domain-containing protein [Peptostreptococcus sp.]|uniref:YhgE/Pip domain-containing protein n=1 Tax=Peptostreptococcus sp. TaxID=1262 RepID=UPI002FCB9FB0